MLSKKLYLHVVQFINWQLILLEYLLYGIEFVCIGIGIHIAIVFGFWSISINLN